MTAGYDKEFKEQVVQYILDHLNMSFIQIAK